VLFDTTQVALERTIQGAGLRQTALASNLANANTPGYQRVDVDFHSALSRALGQGTGASAAVDRTSFSIEADRSVGANRADGGSLDPDAEAAKMAANALEQQAAVQVAAARTAILKSAMGTA
jgi:flagellar basal-body rod protein FlgB